MSWDEIFKTAYKLLSRKEDVAQAYKLYKNGNKMRAKEELSSLITAEFERLRCYSITGKLSADAQTLNTLQKITSKKLLADNLKNVFPIVSESISKGTMISNAWRLITKPLEFIDATGVAKVVRSSVAMSLKVIPLACGVITNKDGLRDKLKSTCRSLKKTIKVHIRDVVHKIKEKISKGDNIASSAIRKAVVETLRSDQPKNSSWLKSAWNKIKSSVFSRLFLY